MILFRQKTIFTALFFSILFRPCVGFSQEILVDHSVEFRSIENVTRPHQPEWFKDFLKGEKAHDAVLIGLWSSHLSSNTDYRTTHNLFGVQYNGYFAGTLANSYSHQIFIAGIARTVAQKKLGEHWLLEAGYKIGPMYGYRDDAPNIYGGSVLPLACFGISFRDVGVDLNLVPGNALSFNMRINF